VDFIGANIYAWWDNVYIPPPFVCETEINGPQITFNNYMKVQNLYSNIPVILTEFGWPSCNTGYSCTSRNVVDGSTCAKANDANQKKFVQGVVDIFRKNQRPCSTFAAFREAWKGTNDADINQHWGVCSGSAPYTCSNAPV
jgi:exo-beta-1,3-glucanase (GH17 family)